MNIRYDTYVNCSLQKAKYHIKYLHIINGQIWYLR